MRERRREIRRNRGREGEREIERRGEKGRKTERGREGDTLKNNQCKTHSTHLIYGYMAKNHSDGKRGNPLPPHGLLLPISSNGSFICTIPQDSTYHRLWYTK